MEIDKWGIMNKLGREEERDGKKKEIYPKEEGRTFTRAFKERYSSIRDM
jgi:hypothetical protein